MKVRCAHGYFFFDEERVGEISRFSSTYDVKLVAKDWYYTFEALKDAPDFSIAGVPYLGVMATMTFAGTPWDVMRANGLVYDFEAGEVKRILSIRWPLALSKSQYYYFADGLLMPGSVSPGGLRVTDYSGQFEADALKFRYTEVLYE